MAFVAIFTGRGPYSAMQSGASTGSSVGNTNDWILFLWSTVVISSLCFRSATSHLVQNTPKHCFWTQNTQNKKENRYFEKICNFCPMMREIAKRRGFFPNEVFWVAKSAVWPHGANPPHIHMHMRKMGQFFKISGFP